MRITTARDALNAIPAILGYQPHNSLTLLLLEEHHASVLRLDLIDDDTTLDTLTRTATRTPTPRQAILAIYSDHPWPATPQTHLAHHARTRLTAAGIPITTTLLHTPTGWGTPGTTPHPPTALAEAPVEDFEGALALPIPGHGERVAYATALALCRGRSLAGDLGLALDPVASAEEAMRSLAARPEDLARLTSAIVDGGSDGAELVAATFAWGAARGNALATAGPSLGGASLHLSIAGMTDQAPEPARLELACLVMSRTLCLSPRCSDRAALLSVLAWLWWARGSGTIALAMLDRVEIPDPDDRIATMVEGLASRGRLPDWAFTRSPVLA